jgi:hypothetical protein
MSGQRFARGPGRRLQRPLQIPTAGRGLGAVPPRQTRQLDIIALLHTAPIRSFDLSTAAVVTGPFIEGRVCIRMDGRSWSLPTVSCSVLALLVRLERSLRACDLFADAFNAAVVQAEAKVDAVNAWSARVRPGAPASDQEALA